MASDGIARGDRRDDALDDSGGPEKKLIFKFRRETVKQLTAILLLLAVPFSSGLAQDTGKTLAATLDVFVFPTEGQATDQQSKDEAACYSWATDNTGSDPFQLQKDDAAAKKQAEQQVAQTQAATQGAGAKGAVKGAAAGAIIGEVSGGDAGESAAIGAAAVGISSRRRARSANQQAEQQAEQQSEASEHATEEQVGNFKKAFSVCLEAKDYMVKF
jgi:hypothetical protein